LDLADKDISDIIVRSSATQLFLQASCGALWDGYSALMNASGTGAGRISVTKVFQFSAARMIQSALESAANQANLFPVSVLQLQIAENLLSEPEEMGFQLFGLP
jgi:hypothetical protein